MSSDVDAHAIEGLPTNGRDFVAFALLTPGVVAERTPPTGPTTSSGPVLRRPARPLEPRAWWTASTTTTPFTGAVAATFSQDAVREFQVLAASAPAEFGHAVRRHRQHRHPERDERLARQRVRLPPRPEPELPKEHFEEYDVFGNPVDDAEGALPPGPVGRHARRPAAEGPDVLLPLLRATDTDASNFVTIDAGAAAALEKAGFPSRSAACRSPREPERPGQARPQPRREPSPDRPRPPLDAGGTRTSSPSAASWRGSHGAEQERTTGASPWPIPTCSPPAGSTRLASRLVGGDQGIYGLDPRCGGSCRDDRPGRARGHASRPGRGRPPAQHAPAPIELRPPARRYPHPQPRPAHPEGRPRPRPRLARRPPLAQDFGGRYVFTALPAIPGLVPRPLHGARGPRAGPSRSLLPGLRRDHDASGTSRMFSVFAQDRWRVSPRDWSSWAACATSGTTSGLPPVAASDLGGARSSYHVPARGDLAPRLAPVTFDPTDRGRTSFRGAFGVFHEDPLLAVTAGDRDRQRAAGCASCARASRSRPRPGARPSTGWPSPRTPSRARCRPRDPVSACRARASSRSAVTHGAGPRARA